jgi:hypothetical protein
VISGIVTDLHATVSVPFRLPDRPDVTEDYRAGASRSSSRISATRYRIVADSREFKRMRAIWISGSCGAGSSRFLSAFRVHSC